MTYKSRIDMAECQDLRKLSLSRIPLYIQPISITYLPADLNLSQLSLIYAITDYLQPRLYNLLFEGSEHLFEEEEGELLTLNIPRTFLSVPPSDYSRCLRQALALCGLPLDYLVWDDSYFGYRRERLVLIRQIEMKSRERFFRVQLDRHAAERIFQMKQYTCCARQTLFACKTARAKRLYLFISTFRLYGLRRISYMEFMEQMGLDNRLSGSTNENAEGTPSYPYFSEFYRSILSPAMKELQSLAEKGYADCYFKVSVDYPGVKKKGNPSMLNFHIIHTAGVPSILSSLPPTPYQDILDLMVDSLEIARARAKYILSSVTEEEVCCLRAKVRHLKAMLDDGHHVERVGAWAATSIINLLNELRSHKQQRVEKQKQQEHDIELKAERPPLKEENVQSWIAICSEWQRSQDPAEFEQYLARVRLHSYGSDCTLYLYVPDLSVKNYIEMNLNRLAPPIRHYFPSVRGIRFLEEPNAWLYYQF